MTRRRKLIYGLVPVALLLAVWLIANPPGRFGWCRYAYTTYGGWPRLIYDFQVRADGSTRVVHKTHRLALEQIEWLLASEPEVLIVALGWDGVVTPDDRIRGYSGCELHLLRNREAINLFNRLKRAGRRVAIHYHSTC